MTDTRARHPELRRRLLDPGWRFHRGDLPVPLENTHAATYFVVKIGQAPGAAGRDYEDSAWREVDLPHDFVVEGHFAPEHNTDHGALPVGVAWYRKRFLLPEGDRGRRLWLQFDGVFRNSQVWLNGFYLGRHASGYTGFRYDISDVADYSGENVLAVRVDASEFEGWWYEGGGIYRHVWLLATDPLHVEHDGLFVLATPREDFTEAAVEARVEVTNDSDQARQAAVEAVVLDAQGQTVARMAGSCSVPPWSTTEVTASADLASPHRWSVEDPYLYRLVATLREGERVADVVETTCGVRSFRWDPDQGFFLNGQPLKLKGTCNHQDHAGVGIALPDRVQEWRIARLKAMGCNAYRCAHNPPAPELLDAGDRLGLLVLDENRYLSVAPEHLQDLREMVRRDRNHPSVLAWSLGNEEPIQGTEEGTRLALALRRVVQELDPTRAVTYAMSGSWGEAGFSAALDVMGCNYNIPLYDEYHQRFPQQPMLGAETASTLSTRGIYAQDEASGYVSAYDANQPGWGATAEQAWQAVADRPFLAGTFVWTGFDYRGESTPYVWPCISSHFGIMDTCGFPKDNYYYYQAWWTDRPVLHLLPHWNWPGREGETIEVWAHSNCERVELLLNGESLGAQEMPRNGHLVWQVPYQPGVLLARGYNDGQPVAEARVETTGGPAQVTLAPDRAALQADGEDVALVTVTVLDAAGRVVPVADNEVRFSLVGPGRILGVGNGNPSSHEPDQADRRRVFGGLCQVLVGTTREAGEIVLRAESPGLPPAEVTLTAAPCTPRAWL